MIARDLKPWLTFAGLVLIVFALYWAQALLVPIVLAALLAFVLTPAVTWLERRIGRVPSILATALVMFGFFGLVAWALAHQIDHFAADLPRYRANILAKIAELRGGAAGPAGGAVAAQDVVAKIDDALLDVSWLGALLGPLGTAGFVMVLVLFMLVERKTLRDRLISMVGHGQLVITTRAFDEAGTRVSRQLMLQCVVNLMYGAVIATGLMLLRVPYPFIWGGLAAVLRFIPYVGFAVAVAAPVLVGIAALPGWGGPLGVIVLFACLELFTSVVVETRLYAGAAGVSQVALLVSVAFWAWLWGPAGLLMATPLTVCLVVLGKHVPGLEAVGRLMTDSPALAPDDGYYQRLLARDLADAAERVESHIKSAEPRSVFDALLIPGLSYAARDRLEDRLSDAEETQVIDATRELLNDASEAIHRHEGAGAVRPSPASRLPRMRLLGVPGSGASGELVVTMLSRYLDDLPIDVTMASGRPGVSELLSLIRDKEITAVCFADLPPNSASKARYLVRRLRAELPDLPIVVGRWSPPALADDSPRALQEAGATVVVTTFEETRAYLSRLSSGTQSKSSGAGDVHAA